MELVFSGQIFKKYSNIKFHKDLPVVAKLYRADGPTDRPDRRDETETRCLQFRERAKKPVVVLRFCVQRYSDCDDRPTDMLAGTACGVGRVWYLVVCLCGFEVWGCCNWH